MTKQEEAVVEEKEEAAQTPETETPAADTEAEPFAKPHSAGLEDDESTTGVGSLTDTEAVPVQPLRSVTVTEYVPATSPTGCASVEPFDHR